VPRHEQRHSQVRLPIIQTASSPVTHSVERYVCPPIFHSSLLLIQSIAVRYLFLPQTLLVAAVTQQTFVALLVPAFNSVPTLLSPLHLLHFRLKGAGATELVWLLELVELGGVSEA
jgi:hypothetical protein